MDRTFDTSPAPLSARSQRKALNLASRVVPIAAGLLFLFAGATKLRGGPDVAAGFETIGFGQRFRYLTGIMAVAGGPLLLTPRFSGFGALLLVPVMIGAVAAHLTVFGGSPVAALVLLVGMLFVAWVRRDQIVARLGRARFDTQQTEASPARRASHPSVAAYARPRFLAFRATSTLGA